MTVPCVNTSLVQIFQSTIQLIGGVQVVRVCMGLLLVYYDWCVDVYKVTAIIVDQGLVVHVTLKSARYIFCQATKGSTTNLGGIALYIED